MLRDPHGASVVCIVHTLPFPDLKWQLAGSICNAEVHNDSSGELSERCIRIMHACSFLAVEAHACSALFFHLWSVPGISRNLDNINNSIWLLKNVLGELNRVTFNGIVHASIDHVLLVGRMCLTLKSQDRGRLVHGGFQFVASRQFSPNFNDIAK